jgi:4,5-DOPA dioxygenase extradiol
MNRPPAIFFGHGTPTPDHFLPLLYGIVTAQRDDRITFPVQDVDGGSISMITVQVG